MPTTAGVYIAGLTAGTEVSSTYEGRHLTMREDELIHPLHGDVFVNKGDPVIIALAQGVTPHTVYGQAVGIALADGAALADMIAVDTEGIWNLLVYAFDDNGGVDVNPGDALFLSDDSSTVSHTVGLNGVGDAALSKIRNNLIQIPFGYAQGYIGANANGVIAVKVHWDPRAHWLLDNEMLYFGSGVGLDADVTLEWNGTDLEMLPVLDDTGAFKIGDGTNSMDFQVFGLTNLDYMLYDNQAGTFTMTMTALGAAIRLIRFIGTNNTPNYGDGYGMIEEQLNITGIQAGQTALRSAWINLGSATVIDSYLFIHTDGIWDEGGGNVTAGSIGWAKIQFQLKGNPTWLSIFELNSIDGNNEIDSIYNCNNYEWALGYEAGGVGETDAPVGFIPFCSIAHGLVKYIYLYDHP